MVPFALELSGTIRHDGNGGVADDLADTAGFAAWLAGRADVDLEHTRVRVVALRRAVRSLFAHAVANQSDPSDLLDRDTALATVNAAAAAVPRTPVLNWPPGTGPRLAWASDRVDTETALLADLARSAIEVLTGADHDRLRACPAPRCVRYFVQDHPRQTWCKPSCGNRARVSRHYQRHHEPR